MGSALVVGLVGLLLGSVSQGRPPAHDPQHIAIIAQQAENARLQAQLEELNRQKRDMEAQRKQLAWEQQEMSENLRQEQEEQKEAAARITEEEASIAAARAENDRRAKALQEEIAREWPKPAWLLDGRPGLCITGLSGVGKSTLVNCALGLRPSEAGAAAVGVEETTMTPAPYIINDPGHPLHGLVLYDLPGSGTANFPAVTYIKQMGIRYCPAVAVVTGTRITETDAALFVEARRWGIPTYIFRNKVNVDFQANLDDKGIAPEATFRELKAYVLRELRRNPDFSAADEQRVFLLSAKAGCYGKLSQERHQEEGRPLLVGEMQRFFDLWASDLKKAYAVDV